MKDVEHYSMILEWDPEDEIFVVTVPELPGCRTHGVTREEATRQGRDAISGWIGAAQACNEPIPQAREFAR